MKMDRDVLLNFISDPGRNIRLQVFDSVVEANPLAATGDLEVLLRLISWHSQWETQENAVKNVLSAITPKNTGESG